MTGANAKIKRILVRQNGVEKQVRPYRYEYSYDFSNGSSSQMQTDGWTLVSSASTYSFSSDGITASSYARAYIQPSGFQTAIQSAKKIQLTFTYKKTGSSAQCNSGIFTDLSSATLGTFIYIYDSGYQFVLGGTSKRNTSYSVSNNTYNNSIEVDLVNKTSTFTLPGISTQSYSITDSEITNIRTNKGIRIVVDSNSYLKNVNLILSF